VAGVGIAGRLQRGDHVCAFVDDVHDGLDLMAQTVVAGLDAGEKVMVFTAALLPVAVRAGLHARGVTVPQDRQVQVLPAREAYLPSGRFEPPRMLDSLAGRIDQATADGFAGLRLVGDMTWALDRPAGVEQLAGYEAHVNQLYLDGRALGICLYDRRAFRADLLRQVAEAHPTMTSPGAEADWAPLLRIRRTADPYGLRLTGDADLSNRRALAAALDQQPDPATPILIDVTELRFADAGTAGLLGRLALQAPAGVHLTGARAVVETVLDRVGVGQLSKVRLTGAIGGAGSSETEVVA
jgi:hypothetical protein